MVKEKGQKFVAQNKKARHDYHIEDTYEAGMVLMGTEVKSLRAGRAPLTDGFVDIDDHEVWLHSVHIPEYPTAPGPTTPPAASLQRLARTGPARTWEPAGVRGASEVAAAGAAAAPSQPGREASGWAHDGASDARHRGGGPALRSRRRAARARQRALRRSRRVGGLRAGGRLELRGHGPVRVASPARVALRAADGPGGLCVVPRAALRGGLAARVHARHRPRRPLGPDLRPRCC